METPPHPGGASAQADPICPSAMRLDILSAFWAPRVLQHDSAILHPPATGFYLDLFRGEGSRGPNPSPLSEKVVGASISRPEAFITSGISNALILGLSETKVPRQLRLLLVSTTTS